MAEPHGPQVRRTPITGAARWVAVGVLAAGSAIGMVGQFGWRAARAREAAGGPPPAVSDPSVSVLGEPIDVNRADEATLRLLPGIGPALARRIVADRAAAGPFRSLEDLARVRGIGPRTLERLRERVCTGVISGQKPD